MNGLDRVMQRDVQNGVRERTSAGLKQNPRQTTRALLLSSRTTADELQTKDKPPYFTGRGLRVMKTQIACLDTVSTCHPILTEFAIMQGGASAYR